MFLHRVQSVFPDTVAIVKKKKKHVGVGVGGVTASGDTNKTMALYAGYLCSAACITSATQTVVVL